MDWIYWSRLKFYHKMGFTNSQLGRWCERFGYSSHVANILTCTKEGDLPTDTVEYIQKNLGGGKRKLKDDDDRTSFEKSRDILMDGLCTDIIHAGTNHYYPTLKISKNKQDKKLDLVSKASIDPDFEVEIDGQKYLIEMKTMKNKVDKLNRNVWSGTFTIRKDDLEKEFSRYEKYNTRKHPLLFLRINPEDGLLAVIPYSKFRPSKSPDGSYYAYYTPIKFNTLEELCKGIGRGIVEGTEYIKRNFKNLKFYESQSNK